MLLVGNSYTSANDLAGVLEGMLEADGAEARTEARAPGGARFPDHLAEADGSNGDTQLRQWLTTDVDGWHAVVFQDQSQVPGFYDQDPSYDASLDAFVDLDLLAQAAPGNPESVLFMTWGRRHGDSMNEWLFPDFSTMQDRLEEGYRRYAAAVDAPRVVHIAPVGLAFAAVHDGILADGGTPTDDGTCFSRLYSGDGSHPSAEGTWVAGATIAATLTGIVPEPPVDDCGEVWALAVEQAVEAEGAIEPGDDDASVQQPDDDDTVGLGDDDDDAGGCSCRSSLTGGGSGLLTLLLAVAARRRR